MKYTNNYHLPQWVQDDLILMDDFNKMNENIEAGIDTARGEAAEAQAVANSAKVAANAAQQSAGNAYSPSNKPYVTGTFTGNGGTQEINLGFRPSFVIIGADQIATSDVVAAGRVALSAGGVNTRRISLTSNGFRVHFSETTPLPRINYNNGTFDYIAFR